MPILILENLGHIDSDHCLFSLAGTYWESITGEIYMWAQVSNSKFAMISLETGNRFDDPTSKPDLIMQYLNADKSAPMFKRIRNPLTLSYGECYGRL